MNKHELIVKILNTLDLIEVRGVKNIQLMYGLIGGLQEELELENSSTPANK